MKRRSGILIASLLAFSLLAGCKDDSESVVTKDAYDFTYNVNYVGGQNRVITVSHGQRASNWNAKRSGYELETWYETSELVKPFDFNKAIVEDTVVFAKWNERVDGEPVAVTFDFNYGDREPVIVTATKGQPLAAAFAPDPKRIGNEVEGWYFEKSFITKFKFNDTIVTEPITLYANYNDVTNFTRDANGNIIYNDVSLNIAVNDAFNIGGDFVSSIVQKFNIVYNGKIRINVVDNRTVDNSLISLKFHQTNVINRSGDYYNMADVLDLAGITFEEDEFDYYANQDNYKDGVLRSYPVGHIIPALVYNVNKLKTYFPAFNDSNVLPSTYEEFYTAMKAFTAAEGKHALITDDSWPFLEGAANLSFAQNDIMHYDYDRAENRYYSKWVTDDGHELARGAIRAIHNYFGPNSLVKGTKEGDFGSLIYDRVSTGDALFALTSNKGTLEAANLAGTEIMPVTNFFNITNSENSRNFIGNYSMAITESGPSDYHKIAAAAVFADYFSKNATKLGERGLVPALKSMQQGEFMKSTNLTTSRLRRAVTLDKMITLPGHWQEFTIFNNNDNGNFDAILMYEDLDDDTLDLLVTYFGETFEGLVA